MLSLITHLFSSAKLFRVDGCIQVCQRKVPEASLSSSWVAEIDGRRRARGCGTTGAITEPGRCSNAASPCPQSLCLPVRPFFQAICGRIVPQGSY